VGATIFDREEYRTDKFRLGKDDPNNPAWELINELLDSAIVQDWRNRIATAEQLLERVNNLIKVLRADGHAITLSVPHRCLFCAQGIYSVQFDGTKPLPARSNEHIAELGRRETFLRALGFGTSNSATWIILVCQKCGHVLTFRPDLSPSSAATWRRR